MFRFYLYHLHSFATLQGTWTLIILPRSFFLPLYMSAPNSSIFLRTKYISFSKQDKEEDFRRDHQFKIITDWICMRICINIYFWSDFVNWKFEKRVNSSFWKSSHLLNHIFRAAKKNSSPLLFSMTVQACRKPETKKPILIQITRLFAPL